MPPDNVFDFLRTANKGAVAGVAKTEDEVNLLAAVTKGFGDTSQAATQEAADLSQLMVKLGQTTIPELAASYGKAVPLANALGVSNRELAASSAALFGVTGNTSEVMTQQKAVFTALITQNPILTAGLEKMGYATSQQAIEALGLKGALDGLVATTGGSTQALQQMLGSSEAVTAALALTGAQSETFASNLDAMGNSAGTVDTAFERMDSGVAATGRKLAATAATIAIDVGEKFQAIGPFLLALNQGGQLFGVSPAKLVGGAAGAIAGKLAGKLGPAIASALGKSVATSAGSSIAGGVVSAGASSAVAGAAGATGSTIGGLMAAGIGVGLAAAAGVAIALAFKAIVLDPGLQEQSRGIGKSVGEQIVKGTSDELEQSKAALQQGINDINKLPLGGFLYGDQLRDLQTQLDNVNAEIERRATASGDAVAGALEAGGAKVGAAAQDMVDPITGAVTDAAAAAGIAARQLPADVAKGIHDARQKPLDAFDALVEALKHPMSKTAEIARLTGELTSKALSKGLASGDPEIRAQAQATKAAIIERLNTIAPTAGTISKASARAIEVGLKSKDADIRAAAQHIQDIVTGKLEATKVPAGNAGTAAGESFAAKLRKAVAAGDFHVNAQVGFTIPGHAAGGVAKAGQPAIFGEKGWEVAVPEQDYRVFTHQQSVEMMRPAASGRDITVKVYNPAPEPASTSTRRELRKLSLSGSAA